MNDQTEFTITKHALHRWRQRVHRVSLERAHEEITSFLSASKPSTRPKRWMDVGPATSDVRYWYRVDWPQVALVVRGGVAVVSVLAKEGDYEISQADVAGMSRQEGHERRQEVRSGSGSTAGGRTGGGVEALESSGASQGSTSQNQTQGDSRQ